MRVLTGEMDHPVPTFFRQVEVSVIGGAARDVREVGHPSRLQGVANLRVLHREPVGLIPLAGARHVLAIRDLLPVQEFLAGDVHERLVAAPVLREVDERLTTEGTAGTPGQDFGFWWFVQTHIQVAGRGVRLTGRDQRIVDGPVLASREAVERMGWGLGSRRWHGDRENGEQRDHPHRFFPRGGGGERNGRECWLSRKRPFTAFGSSGLTSCPAVWCAGRSPVGRLRVVERQLDPVRTRMLPHTRYGECETFVAGAEGFNTFIDAGVVARIATDQRKSVFTVGTRCVPAPSRTLNITESPALTFAAGP